MHTVYNLLDNQDVVFYVGYTRVSLASRRRQHLVSMNRRDRPAWPVHEKIRSIGIKNFKIQELEKFETKKDALCAESKWIKHYIENGIFLYNLNKRPNQDGKRSVIKNARAIKIERNPPRSKENLSSFTDIEKEIIRQNKKHGDIMAISQNCNTPHETVRSIMTFVPQSFSRRVYDAISEYYKFNLVVQSGSSIFDTMSTESVKINSEIVARIRKQVKTSGQTISGFINLVLDHRLCQIEMDDKVVINTNRRLNYQRAGGKKK